MGQSEGVMGQPHYTLYSDRPRSDRTLKGKGTHMAAITEVTDTNFVAEVIEADQPVLVDFWAPWCGPCRVVAPVLEEIADERDDIKVVKLNTDENMQTTAQYEVLSIPTLIVFKNGEVAKKVIGAYPKRKLEAELEPVLA
jgi:thioredoxin 1